MTRKTANKLDMIQQDTLINYIKGLADDNRYVPHSIKELIKSSATAVGKAPSYSTINAVLNNFGLTWKTNKNLGTGIGVKARLSELEHRFEALLGWAKSAGYEDFSLGRPGDEPQS